MVPVMLKNFFINALRNMRKQRGYVVMNVSGLAIGLTSFLFITLYVIHELSYDRFHENYENIYRLKVVGVTAAGEIDQAATAVLMARSMMNDNLEVLVAARITQMGDWLVKYGKKRFNESDVLYADSTSSHHIIII